jgi:hypothetical protein
MRTAISVLYNYKFEKQISGDAVVRSIVHSQAIQELPIRKPLRLKWEIPQLLRFIQQMGNNENLTHTQLTGKCIVLTIATTAARYTEIQQFALNDSDPQDMDSTWAFLVRIKNRECRQPVILHRTIHKQIDPVLAMIELRRRIRTNIKTKHWKENTFLYNENWTVMAIAEIRDAAKHLLQTSGIDEDRPYHIKHAAITWLKKQRTAPDDIIRFTRHSPASTTYMDYYLAEDFGAACSEIIERTAMGDDATSNIASDHQEEQEAQERMRLPNKPKSRRRSI